MEGKVSSRKRQALYQPVIFSINQSLSATMVFLPLCFMPGMTLRKAKNERKSLI